MVTVQSPIKVFDSVVRNFLKNKETILNKIVTRWLLSKKTVLGRSTSDFFKMYTDDGMTLFVDNTQIVDLSQNELAGLAKKACGWLFLSPVTATSFIISIAEFTEDDEIAAFISDLIYFPLAIAYAGSVKNYLLEVSTTASPKVKAIATTVLAKLERYHTGLEAAHSIKELQPPLAHRQAYHRQFARLMADARKQASKQSILTKIFGRSSTLLYGTSSVHSVHDINGNTTRKEIPMSAIKTSVEFPSLEYIDPHSLDYMLHMFRLEGCTE